MIELYTLPAGIPDNLDRSRPVVIIDIFRASTSIAAALAAGAREIHVAESQAEVDDLKERIGGKIILAGERHGFKIEGYDLGNSPREMTADVIAGRTVVFNSTNGTRLLRRFADFAHVAAGSFVCLSATINFLAGFDTDPVFCCAGQLGMFSAEDTLAAGMILSRMKKADEECDDAANFARRLIDITGTRWKEWAGNSFHGRYLASIGLAADLDYCLTIDKFDFLPVMISGKIIRSGRV